MAKKKTVAELNIDIAANTAKLSQDMGKAVSILGDFQKKVSSMNNTLKGMFAFDIARTVIPEVLKLTSALGSLADQGEKVGSIRDAFEALGGSSSALKDAQKATLGTVSAFDLMATANQALIRGIPQFNDHFGRLSELAQRFADATGRDTSEVLNQLTEALGKGKSKGLEPFGFALDGLKGKTEIQNAVFAQLEETIDRYAPSLDSASNAQAAFNTALDDGLKNLGIAVNSSGELTNAWRDLTTALEGVDWKGTGESIAYLASLLVNLASTVLPSVVSLFKDIGNITEYYLGNSSRAKLAGLQSEVEDAQRAVRNYTQTLGFNGSRELKQLQATAAEKQKIFDDAIAAEKAAIVTANAEKEQLATVAANKQKEFEEKRLRDAAARELEAQAKKIQAAKDAFSREINTQQSNAIEVSIQSAINNLDTTAFQAAATKLKDAYKTGIIDAHKEAIANGIPLADVEKFAEKEAQMKIDKYNEGMEKAIKDNAKKEEDEQKKAYEASIGMWQSLFQNAITGVTFNLQDALEQVAVGFAAKLAATTLGDLGLGNITSASGLGGAIFDKLGLGAMLGGSSTTAAAHAAGIYGPGLANGTFGAGAGAGLSMAALVPVAAAAAGAYLMQHDVKNILSGKNDTSAVGTAARVSGAISSSGFTEVARASGLFGKGRNGEDLAIHQLTGSIEEMIRKFSTIMVGDSKNGFSIKSTKGFNLDQSSLPADWAEKMDSWGSKAKSTFLGLGEALKQVNGITEDVAGQIGYLLGEALGGTVDAARLNVQKLGLSFEEIEQAFVDIGKSGDKTWHEIEVSLQGVAEAFKPGLEAVGDVKGAMDEILASGGRGQEALKGVRDTAVETLEAGGKTLADLKKKMLEQGTDPAVADAFMQALEQRGIKTLDALANAQDRVVGGVIADLYSGNKAIADQWDAMGKSIENISKIMTDLPDSKTIEINFVSNMDEATKAAVDSGLIGNPTAGTSTSAPSLPPRTSAAVSDSGAVGRSARANLAPVTVNIDARNAQRGVEADVMNAMAAIEGRTMRRTVNAIQQMGERG